MMDEQQFYEGLYREVQDNGVSGWYVKKSHLSLEKGFNKVAGRKILEVGGNVGEHINYVNEEYLEYMLTDYRDTGFKAKTPKITFQVADVHNLPFKNDSFDRTIATCLLHHLHNPTKALEEIRRVTSNRGVVSLLVPCDPGLAYRLAKKVGPNKKWRDAGVTHPDFHHYEQHRNHFPGVLSKIQEVFKSDSIDSRYWPLRINSWNLNLFTVSQIEIRK
jgi:SAM-dependent methyltransferase